MGDTVERFKNVSRVPVPLEDGRTVAPGEWADIKPGQVKGVTKDAVDLGHLKAESQPTKPAKQEDE